MPPEGPDPNSDRESVLRDAQWLPMHIDLAAGVMKFVWLPRAAQSQLPFLSVQYLNGRSDPVQVVPLSQLPVTSPPGKPPHYIFHSAFCCSTLLARALDVPGVSMGLREPQLLIELAALARAQRLESGRLEQCIGLLARPFGTGEMVVVKPGNEANVLAERLLSLDQRSRALLLYAPLPRFLRSIARKGMWGRIWGRRLFALLERDGYARLGFSVAELFEQTDLQVAALAWLLHQAHFSRLLGAYPDQIRIVDSETFLANRSESLCALSRHFGLPADEQRWEAVATGPVFREHSKEIGRAFSETLTSTKAECDPATNEEIELVLGWVAAVAKQLGISTEPPSAARLVNH